MNDIVIFHGKYGDEIYDASTNEALSLACASVIKKRFNAGWYFAPQKPEVSEENRALIDMDEKQIDALPAAVRDSIAEKRDKLKRVFARRMQEYTTELEDWEAIVKIAMAPTLEEAASYQYNYPKTPKARPSSLAFWVIDGHSDWEYEGYTIESLGKPVW